MYLEIHRKCPILPIDHLHTVMKAHMPAVLLLCGLSALFLTAGAPPRTITPPPGKAASGKALAKHYLYVATPGIRDYLGFGGHGLLVFDMDNQHRFVKRISTKGLHPNGKPSNVKGIAVSIPLNSIYVSTLESLQRIDLTTEKVVWEKIL